MLVFKARDRYFLLALSCSILLELAVSTSQAPGMTALALHHKLHSSSSLNEPVQAPSSSGHGLKHTLASPFLGGTTCSQTSLNTSVGVSNLHTQLDVAESDPAHLSLEVRSHIYNPLRMWDTDRASEERGRTSGDTLRRVDWEVKVRKKIKYIRAGRIALELIFGSCPCHLKVYVQVPNKRLS